MWQRVKLLALPILAVSAIAWAQTEQPIQWVTIADIHRRADELLNKLVIFLGIQQAYYEKGETYFTERGIPAKIFVIGDRKKVRPPEAAYNPPPFSLWLVGGHVRKLRDIVYVEVADVGRESKWKGYQLLQSKHWLELLLVLLALVLLHSILFLAFFNLTEKPSGSVRAAYLLCLWALVCYLLLREPFRFFFAMGTIGFIVLMIIAGLLSLFLLLSLLLRGS